MLNKRQSGVLIHPTSFPGPYGCGDLGDGAIRIIDWLKKSGQSILQILPFGPTGYGDSPYQSFSAFAGTPYLISFNELFKKGYLKKADLKDYPVNDVNKVDYYLLYKNNFKILYKAYLKFKKIIPEEFIIFCEKNSYWLDDYSMFMAIKDDNKGHSWNKWDLVLKAYKNIDKISIDKLHDRIEFYKFIQWEFTNQWINFKNYAKSNDILIIGDAPIFVSYDSSDVWANQELFYLDDSGNPLFVAGVPPDYFSKTGQLWGNPIYRWDIMKKDNFKWWKNRIQHMLLYVDCIRIDHFRGFESFWSIPFGEETAINGKWVKAPGFDFFSSLKDIYGSKLQEIIIAEDLGIITDEVKNLRDHFNLPGMRIFEFANFPEVGKNNNMNNGYLPENYIENCLAYPGTHDNDTLLGWYNSLTVEKKNDVLNYLKIKDHNDINFAVIESLMKSKANRVIFLIQDLLELPSEYRFNLPGTCGIQNWSWRLDEKMLTDILSEKIYKLSNRTGRI